MTNHQLPSSNTTPLSFPSEAALTDFLNTQIRPEALALWGTAPGTKSIRNLYLEITQGESSLTATPSLIRIVNVATLKIKNSSGAVLVESHQLLSDGTVRYRNRPLSEKMKPGEDIHDAAVRAVKEELGQKIHRKGVEVLMDTYKVKVDREKDSSSYPGLRAEYVLHCVEVKVMGVPDDGEFCTDEEGEGHEADSGAVAVKKHFWRWVRNEDDD